MNIKSNEVVIIAGKGHEIYQEYAFKKYFSDKNFIQKYIKEKNKTLNKNWKSNIISEVTKKKIGKNLEELEEHWKPPTKHMYVSPQENTNQKHVCFPTRLVSLPVYVFPDEHKR